MIKGYRQRCACCLLVTVLVAGFYGMGISSAIAGAEKAAIAETALSVVSDPEGATVYVDGQPKGVTPLQLEQLLPGEHRVRVAKDGYLENSRVVKLETGRTHAIDVKLTPASEETRHSIQVEAEEEGGGSKLKWILPAAAGGGAAAFLLLRETNDPPVAGAVQVQPSIGLASVTSFSFTSTASDPNDDPMTFSWDFGDGSNGSGTSPTHMYTSSGTYNVTVTVSDGKESVTASGSVTVRDMTGTWSGSYTYQGQWPFTFMVIQNGTLVSGSFTQQGMSGQAMVSGSVSAPLHMELTVTFPGYYPAVFRGECSEELTSASGTIAFTGTGITAPFSMRKQ